MASCLWKTATCPTTKNIAKIATIAGIEISGDCGSFYSALPDVVLSDAPMPR
jgi:hypothetical protein